MTTYYTAIAVMVACLLTGQSSGKMQKFLSSDICIKLKGTNDALMFILTKMKKLEAT